MRVRLVDPFAAAAILNNLGFWIVVFSRYKKKTPCLHNFIFNHIFKFLKSKIFQQLEG